MVPCVVLLFFGSAVGDKQRQPFFFYHAHYRFSPKILISLLFTNLFYAATPFMRFYSSTTQSAQKNMSHSINALYYYTNLPCFTLCSSATFTPNKSENISWSTAENSFFNVCSNFQQYYWAIFVKGIIY